MTPDNLLVQCQVFVRHAMACEPLLKDPPAGCAVQRAATLYCGDSFLHGIHDKPGDSVDHYFGYGSTIERDNRCAAAHGLNHGQSERFGPVDWKEVRKGIPQELRFVTIPDLPDKFDAGLVQKAFDLRMEIGAIRGINLGGDLEAHAQGGGDADS